MIRNANVQDLSAIAKIMEYARVFMKRTGNPNQWKDTSPDERLILKDIKDGTGYVMEDAGKVFAYFAFLPGKDVTYSYIEDGSWLNDAPYGTIHRIASDGTHTGVLAACVEFCLNQQENIRIDTHQDNRIMQHLLAKLGFVRCGIIYLLNGEPRIAYQLEKQKIL